MKIRHYDCKLFGGIAVAALLGIAPMAWARQFVDTLTNLRALSAPANDDVYETEGYAVVGDGGHGKYHWGSLSTIVDDGFEYIKLTGVTTGRFVLIPSLKGAGNVLQAGAMPGDAIDDTAAIQTVIDARFRTVVILEGEYVCNNQVLVNGLTITGRGDESWDNATVLHGNQAGTGSNPNVIFTFGQEGALVHV